MRANSERDDPRAPLGGRVVLGGAVMATIGFVALISAMIVYNLCKIEVGTGQQAVLVRKTGLDLLPGMELAPEPKDGRYYKGVQAYGPNRGVLTEGRYFYNPYHWSWEITPQFEVPSDKIGVRIALDGDDLPPGQVLAEEGQKGIRRQLLMPGRYPFNPYAETIELHDPVTIPAGARGVVTLLAGKEPKDPNVFLVDTDERGVQRATLPPGRYPVNPYEKRISIVDCRSKKFHLGQDTEMDFLSADGFPVTLDGVVEFRVIEAMAAEVFVKYNEDDNGDIIDDEIITKIITPESRSLCRTGGSKLNGGQFIAGNDREVFQRNLVTSLSENCKKQGIEILAVAITSIQPPEDIAGPVRAREVAKQELNQYSQEKIQQLSEAQLKVQTLLAEQKKQVVEAEQKAIVQTTKAEQDQQVAITLAEQKLKVAETGLEASKNKARAVVSKAEADAEVIRFKNKAEVAGLATRVEAFDGDGAALAENMLISKLAPSFKTILSNSDGPIMELFGQFTRKSARTMTTGGVPSPSRVPSLGRESIEEPALDPKFIPAPATSPGQPTPKRDSKPAASKPLGEAAPKPGTKPTTGATKPRPELPANPFGPEESSR